MLGKKWLEELGYILWDFKKLTMSFMWEKKDWKIKGLSIALISLFSGMKFYKAVNDKGMPVMLQFLEPDFSTAINLSEIQTEDSWTSFWRIWQGSLKNLHDYLLKGIVTTKFL